MHPATSKDSRNGDQRMKRLPDGGMSKQHDSTGNGQRSKQPTPRGMSPSTLRSPQQSIKYTASPLYLDPTQQGTAPATPPPLPSLASAAASLPITGPSSAVTAQPSLGRPPPPLPVPPGAGVAASPGAQKAAAAAAAAVAAAAKAKKTSQLSLGTLGGGNTLIHGGGTGQGQSAAMPGAGNITGAGTSFSAAGVAAGTQQPLFALQQAAFHPQSPPFPPHAQQVTQHHMPAMGVPSDGAISATASATNLPGEGVKDIIAGGDGMDLPEEPDPKVHEDRRGVRFCPPKLFFRDVFELDTRAQRFVLRNVRMRPVNLVVLEPASVLFSLDQGGFSGSLAPGMQYTDILKMSLRQHGHIEGTISTFMTVLIDGHPENYEIEMHQAVPCLEVSPCELDFGVVDVSAPVRSLALRVRNRGRLMCAFAVDVNAGALPEAQLLAQELTVRPTKGKVYARKEVRLRCELAPALEGDFDRQIWVRGPGVALPVPVRARVVKPRLELRHSSAVAGSLALLDFGDCFFGTERRRAAGVHSASADVCTFVVLVEQPGGLLMPLKMARERDPALRVFQAHPQEGRIQSFETRIFTFGFNPSMWVDETEGRHPWHRKEFLIFLRVMRVECIDYDVMQDEKPTSETQVAGLEEGGSPGTVRSWGAEGCEAAELRRRQKLSSWGSAVRLCLRAAAIPPVPRATPRTLHFGQVPRGAKACRVLQISNDSSTLPVGFRMHKPAPAGVRVRPDTGELAPGASIELTVELTALALGPPTTRRLSLDLLGESFPLLGPRKRVTMGVLNVRVEHHCPMKEPHAAPRFTMGISPLITHEVGLVGDGVPFCTRHPLPHAAMQRFDLRGNFRFGSDTGAEGRSTACYCVGMDKSGRRYPCKADEEHAACWNPKAKKPKEISCRGSCAEDAKPLPPLPPPGNLPPQVTCPEDEPCDVTCCKEVKGEEEEEREEGTMDTLNDAGTVSQLVEGPAATTGAPSAPSPAPDPGATTASVPAPAQRFAPCPRESGDSSHLQRRGGRRQRQRPAWPPASLRRAAAAAATAATVERLLVPVVPRLTCGVLMEPDDSQPPSPLASDARGVGPGVGRGGGGGGGGVAAGSAPTCDARPAGVGGSVAPRAATGATAAATLVSDTDSDSDPAASPSRAPLRGCVLGNALNAVLRPQIVTDSSTDSEYTPADSSDSFEARWGAASGGGAGQRSAAAETNEHQPCTACTRTARPPSRRRHRRRQRSRVAPRRTGGGGGGGGGGGVTAAGGAAASSARASGAAGRETRRERRTRTTAAFVENPQLPLEEFINQEKRTKKVGSKQIIPVQVKSGEIAEGLPVKIPEKQEENIVTEKKSSKTITSKKQSIASLMPEKEKKGDARKSESSGKQSAVSGAPGEISARSTSWITMSGTVTPNAGAKGPKVVTASAVRAAAPSTPPRPASGRHRPKLRIRSGRTVMTSRGRALRVSIATPSVNSRLKVLTRPPPPPPPPSLAPSTPQVPATPMIRHPSPPPSKSPIRANRSAVGPPPVPYPTPARSPPINQSPPPSPPPSVPPPEQEAEVVVAPLWRADIISYNTHVFVRSGPPAFKTPRVEQSSLTAEFRSARSIGVLLPDTDQMQMSYPPMIGPPQYFETSGFAMGRDMRPVVTSFPARTFEPPPPEKEKKPEPIGIGPPANTTLPASEGQRSQVTGIRKGAQATVVPSNVTGTEDSEWGLDSSSGSSVDSRDHAWPSEGVSLEPMETSAEMTHRELASAFSPLAPLPASGAWSEDPTTYEGRGGGEGAGGGLARCEQLHWALGLVSHGHCPLIAFPNDMGQRSLRPWPANRPTRSIFTGAPRYAPPIDLENQLLPEEVLRRLVQADDARSLLRLLGSYARCRRSVGKGLPPAEYAVSNPTLYNLLDFVPSSAEGPPKKIQPSNRPMTPLVTSTPMTVLADEEEVNALALVPLSPTQLFNVRLSPPQVDFGTVGVGSHVSSRVRVENANEVPVKVRIDSPNAALTVLDGTVYVPPKRARVVFVSFEPFALGRYNGMIQYVVNDTHAFEAPVTAEVVLRSLALPAGPLSFGFVRGVEEAWPSLRHVVSVMNPLQVACRFEWSAFDKTCYDVVPRSGVVPPEGARACEISYRGNPDASSNDAELLLAGESDCYLPLVCRYLPLAPPPPLKPPPPPPKVPGILGGKRPKEVNPQPAPPKPPPPTPIRTEPALSTLPSAGVAAAVAAMAAADTTGPAPAQWTPNQLRRLAAMNMGVLRGANFVRLRLLVPEVGVLRRRRITLLLFNSSFMETLFRVEDEPNYMGSNGVTSATAAGPDGVPRVSWGVWPRRGRLYPRSVRRLRLWVRPLLPGTFWVEIRVALGSNVFSPSSAVGPRPVPIDFVHSLAGAPPTASTLPDTAPSSAHEGRSSSPTALQPPQTSAPPAPPPSTDFPHQYPVSPGGLEQAINSMLDHKTTHKNASPPSASISSNGSGERRKRPANKRVASQTERSRMQEKSAARNRPGRSNTSRSSGRSLSRGSLKSSHPPGGGSLTGPKLQFGNRSFDVQMTGGAGKLAADGGGGSSTTATVRAYATYPHVMVRPLDVRLRRVPAGSLVSVPIALCNTGAIEVPIRLVYGEAMQSGEWALSTSPYRLLPAPQPILLAPRGPPTQLYLQFRPEDVASYEFLLPFQLAGGLGPPRQEISGSHKADYYLCGARDRRAPKLPVVRIDATVSRRLLQLSDTEFRFQYDPSDRRKPIMEHRIIKVENVHLTTLMIWFPLDALEGTPFHMEAVTSSRGRSLNEPFEAPEVALRTVQMMRPFMGRGDATKDRERGSTISSGWGDENFDVAPTVAAIEAAAIAVRIVMAMADTAVDFAEKENEKGSILSTERSEREQESRTDRLTSSIDSQDSRLLHSSQESRLLHSSQGSGNQSQTMDLSNMYEELQQEALEHVVGLFRIADGISKANVEKKKPSRAPESGRALCCVLAAGASCAFTLSYAPQRVTTPPVRPPSTSPSTRAHDTSRTLSPFSSATPDSSPAISPVRSSRSPATSSYRKSFKRQSSRRQTTKRSSSRRSTRSPMPRSKRQGKSPKKESEVEWSGWPSPTSLALPLHVGCPGAGEGSETPLLHVIVHGEVLTPKLIPSDREIYLAPRPLNVASERMISLSASHLESDAMVHWKVKFLRPHNPEAHPKDPLKVEMFDRRVYQGPRKQNFDVFISFRVAQPLGVECALLFYTLPVNESDFYELGSMDCPALIRGQARCVVRVWAASDCSLLTTHAFLRTRHQQLEPLPPPTGPRPPSPLGWSRSTRRPTRPLPADYSDYDEPPEDEDTVRHDELIDWSESLMSELAMRATARGLPALKSPGWMRSRYRRPATGKKSNEKEPGIPSPQFSLEEVSMRGSRRTSTLSRSPDDDMVPKLVQATGEGRIMGQFLPSGTKLATSSPTESQRRMLMGPRATQLSDADPLYKVAYSPAPSRKASQRSAAISIQSLTTTDRRSDKAINTDQSLLEPETSTAATNRIVSPPPRRHRADSRCDPEEAIVDADQDSLLTSESSGTEEEVPMQTASTPGGPTPSQSRSDDGFSYPAFPSHTDLGKGAQHLRRVQRAVEEWLYDIVFRREYWVSIPFGFNEVWRTGTPRPNKRNSVTPDGGDFPGKDLPRDSFSPDAKQEHKEFQEEALRRQTQRDKSGGTWSAVEAAAGRPIMTKRLSDPRRCSRVSDPPRIVQSNTKGPVLVPTCPFHMGTPFQGIYNLIGPTLCAIVDERIPSPYTAFSSEWWCEQAMGAVGAACSVDTEADESWSMGLEGVGGGDALTEPALMRVARLSLKLYDALLFILRANGATLPHVKAENMLDYKRYEVLKRAEVNRIRALIATRAAAHLLPPRSPEPQRWAGPGGSSVAVSPPGSPMQGVMQAAFGDASPLQPPHVATNASHHRQRTSRMQQQTSNLTTAHTLSSSTRPDDSMAVASATIASVADGAVTASVLNIAQTVTDRSQSFRKSPESPHSDSPQSPKDSTLHPGVGLTWAIVNSAVDKSMAPAYLRPDEDPPKVIPEHLHVRLQRQAWLDVCLQLARVFWLPKVDDEEIHAAEDRARAETRPPAWDEPTQPSQDVRWRQYRVASSSHYSAAELTLLGWLNDCYERERHNMFSDVQLPQRAVANFDSDLADGLVLAAATLHTCPYIASFLHDLYAEPANTEQVAHNGARLVGCWKKLRIGFTVSLRDMVNPLAVKMLLLTAHLHAVLPTLSAPRTLTLQAPLATSARAALALVNPSPLKMQYLVEFIGDMDGFFSVVAPGLLTGHSAETKVKGGGKGVAFPLGPGQRLNLIVRFHARTLTPKSSLLLLTGLVQAPNFGRAIALRLEGSASALDVSATLKVSLPMFRPITRELRVPLPYDAPPPPPRAPKPIRTDSPSPAHPDFSMNPISQTKLQETEASGSDLQMDVLPEFELFLSSIQPTTGQEFAGNAWETLRSLKMLRRCFLNQSRIRALPPPPKPVNVTGGGGVAAAVAELNKPPDPGASAGGAAALAGAGARGTIAGRTGSTSIGAITSSILQGLGSGPMGVSMDAGATTRRSTFRTSSTNIDARSQSTVSSVASYSSRFRSIPMEDYADVGGRTSLRTFGSKSQPAPRGRGGFQRRRGFKRRPLVDDTLAFVPRDIPGGGVRNWATLNVTLCAFTPKVRTHWIACVSPSAGDFIIKMATKPTLGPPLATLQLRLPLNHTTATCTCGVRPHLESGTLGPLSAVCPLRVVLDVPQRNDVMWRAVACMFDKTLDDVERLFWQQHLDSSIALQLMQWMLRHEDGDVADEYAHVFNNRVSYKLSISGDYTVRPCTTDFVINDVRSDGTVPLEVHVQPATAEGHEFRLRLTSEDGREVRLYRVRVYPPAKQHDVTSPAPASPSDGEAEVARKSVVQSAPQGKKGQKKKKAVQDAAKEQASVALGVATGRVVAAAVAAEAAKRWGAGRGGASSRDVSPLMDIKRALDDKGHLKGTGGGRAVNLPPIKSKEGAARRDSGDSVPRRRRSSGGSPVAASPPAVAVDAAAPTSPRRPPHEDEDKEAVRRFPLSFSPLSAPPPSRPKRSSRWRM